MHGFSHFLKRCSIEQSQLPIIPYLDKRQSYVSLTLKYEVFLWQRRIANGTIYEFFQGISADKERTVKCMIFGEKLACLLRRYT